MTRLSDVVTPLLLAVDPQSIDLNQTLRVLREARERGTHDPLQVLDIAEQATRILWELRADARCTSISDDDDVHARYVRARVLRLTGGES